MVDNLTILTHSHTDCTDLWLPYFDSYENHFKGQDHIVLLNESKDFDFGLPVIEYNEFNEKHSDRMLKGLKNIKSKYVIITMEDMFLYDDVFVNELVDVLNFMSENDAFCVRLIKSGISSNTNTPNGKIHSMTNNDFLFSITPTVWDKDKLIELLSDYKSLNVWEMELQISKSLNLSDFKSYYYYNGENKRGRNHFDSSIYPHICSAIYKGKWNTKEYLNELMPIFKKYGIDYEKRGVV
jgi:hypothetical protein